MEKESRKYRDPFEGMSFKGSPVSKEEYLAAYESYVDRCSGSDELVVGTTVISFEQKKVLLDGKELRGVTDIEIRKHASDIADVTMKLKAYIKGLDVA
ncbi:hypothetical protein [Ligilactobacillus animalis]|uniref:hypothetical protein n=1 Tax=Ligilactobacillus animalis TaxID=1605 RepID=UPI0026DFA7B3|nr:hypothetical protein [Ligilactobacillus animalis]MDO5882569.1 hypothetical protein [Ligilactobacillus animalis]